MKTQLSLTFMALLGLATLHACAGSIARQNALIPSMQQAWPGLAVDVGAESEALASEMTAALDSGDELRIAHVDWPTLHASIADGIARTPVSDGVRASLLERLHQFDLAWHRLRR